MLLLYRKVYSFRCVYRWLSLFISKYWKMKNKSTQVIDRKYTFYFMVIIYTLQKLFYYVVESLGYGIIEVFYEICNTWINNSATK